MTAGAKKMFGAAAVFWWNAGWLMWFADLADKGAHKNLADAGMAVSGLGLGAALVYMFVAAMVLFDE